MSCELETINIRLEISDIMRERNMIWTVKREAVVRECSQLLRADELGVIVCAVSERAPNMLLSVTPLEAYSMARDSDLRLE